MKFFMKKAVIDIGSNSIKLIIGQLDEEVKILLDTSEIVQIRKGFVNGGISEEKMQQALKVISEMVKKAREYGTESLQLVGTMALRQASNSDIFLRRVKDATGLEIRILSGEEEANYSWKGAICDLGQCKKDIIMFDTGGGSTEFVFGRGSEKIRSQSLPIGAITITEKFLGTGPISQSSINNAMNYIKTLLAENNIASSSEPFVIGLGGGVTAMASVKTREDHEKLHGTVLTRKDILNQIKLYAPLTLEERKKIPGLPPLRADVITSTACTVLCILEALNSNSCTLSLNGLRHSLLRESFQ